MHISVFVVVSTVFGYTGGRITKNLFYCFFKRAESAARISKVWTKSMIAIRYFMCWTYTKRVSYEHLIQCLFEIDQVVDEF